MFTAHCTAIFALLISSLTYFGGVLTTIERQFQLSSSESGTTTIINDVVSLSLVLFASYFGHRAHRPRWIAAGTILTGLGIFLFAMPHFATNPLDLSKVLYGNVKRNVGSKVCSLGSTGSSTSTTAYLSFAHHSQNESANPFHNTTSRDRCGSTSGGTGANMVDHFRSSDRRNWICSTVSTGNNLHWWCGWKKKACFLRG